MDDVRAVMDSVGSRQAALFGASEGGAMSMLFAATYPDRTRAMVLYGAFAHFLSWITPPDQLEAFLERLEKNWGTGETLASFALVCSLKTRTSDAMRASNASVRARHRPLHSFA